MTVAPITLTPRQIRILIALHDLHLQALLLRTEGKRIPVRLKRAIRTSCLKALQENLQTIRSVPFKVEEVRYILWPERLINSLSGFL